MDQSWLVHFFARAPVKIDRRRFLTASIALGLAARARAQSSATEMHPLGFPQPSETIDLWPQGAPGMPTPPPSERFIERSADPRVNDLAIDGISRPRMVVFKPSQPNGAAILITRGGAYTRIVVGKEGYEFNRRPMASGVTVFVLFYRLPGEGWKSGPDVALSDAQRAMRIIRHRAKDYAIDPERVAAMGFSAGGHLCADLATRFAARTYDPVDAADTLSARPFVAAPIYPVMTMSAPYAHGGSREKLLGANPTPALERAHSPHLN